MGYAMTGIAYAFRSQFNMRFHFAAAFLVLLTAALLKIRPFEWCIILLCISSVIASELINTSIETTVDIVSPKKNENAGQAKDLAAAAVLVTCIVSAIIGSIIFIPKILQLL